MTQAEGQRTLGGLPKAFRGRACATFRQLQIPAAVKLSFSLTCLLVGASVGAQNLVPNPSFEDFYNCPQTGGAWQQVVGWDSPFTTSADYFNACAPPNPAGVPFNQLGWQQAAHGDAYMGVGTCDPNTTYRELIHAELTQPLQIGVPVHLCFKAAVGGFGITSTNSSIYTCKGIGMKFFVNMPADLVEWDAYFQVAPNSAAIYLDVVPTDTAIWYVVSGSYIPDSAYTHIVIGNFFDAQYSEVTVLDSTGYGVSPFAYMFVDDVAVSYDPLICAIGEGWGEAQDVTFSAYPNPFTERCTVEVPDRPGAALAVELVDAMGRVVWSGSPTHGTQTLTIDGSGLPSGLYLLRIGDEKKHWYGHSSLVRETQ